MYSIQELLAPYPAVLSSTDLAQVLGLGERAVAQICRSEVLAARKVGGRWEIDKPVLLVQLETMRNSA